MNISRCSAEDRAARADTAKRLDPGGIDRDQFGEIDVQQSGLRAGEEQVRYLRGDKLSGESHDPSSTFLLDANPAVHNPGSTQDCRHRRRGGAWGIPVAVTKY